MDVSSTLSDISLEFELVCIPLLLGEGLKIVAVRQDISFSFSLYTVKNKGQEFRQGADLWERYKAPLLCRLPYMTKPYIRIISRIQKSQKIQIYYTLKCPLEGEVFQTFQHGIIHMFL